MFTKVRKVDGNAMYVNEDFVRSVTFDKNSSVAEMAIGEGIVLLNAASAFKFVNKNTAFGATPAEVDNEAVHS